MAITFEDKKISELPIVPAVPEFYVPAIDLSQSDPYLRNVRLTVGSIAAQADAVLDLVHQTRLVATTGSLQGGGNLSADRTLSLVGDSAAPGANRYYGTNGASVKGFHALTLGTVTSVAAGNLPPLFTTSVATPTLTPTISFSLNTQLANRVFAGPASGGAVAPTFRALVIADIPNLSSLYGSVSSFSSGSLAPLFTTAVATPTTTPALSFTLTAQAANQVFAGPGAGGALAPTFRALVIADIPSLTTLYQPLDSDLTAIASLGTTAYGRGFLVLADATAARTYIGAGVGNVTSFSSGGLSPLFTTTVATPTTTPALSFTLNAQAANTFFAGPAAAGPLPPSFRAITIADIPSLVTLYQPLDADLTAISALTGVDTIYYRSGSSTWSPVVIGSGLTFSGGTLIATGGGGGGAVDAITGTANQVLVNGTVGTPEIGVITLTLPQDIATTSNVQFGSINSTPIGNVARSTGEFNLTGHYDTANFIKGNGGNLTGSANAAIYLAIDESTIQGTGTNTQIRMGGNLVLGATGTGVFQVGGVSVGSFTTTGINAMPIGATTPSTGAFTTVTSNSGITSNGGYGVYVTEDGGGYWSNLNGIRADGLAFTPAIITIRANSDDSRFVINRTTGSVSMSGGINATPIGQTTPAVGDFTNLAASGNVLFAGVPVAFRVQGGGSGAQYQMFTGAGGNYYIGYSNSLGGGLLNGVGPYGFTIVSEANNNVGIGVNNALVGLFTQTGLNATAIGATTPSTGSFTNLVGGKGTGGEVNLGFATPSFPSFFGNSGQAIYGSDQHRFFDKTVTTQWAEITSTGFQGPIGATTPSAGTFTYVNLAPGLRALTPTHFGYSTAYPVVMLGNVAANQSVSINYDPIANTGNNFNGSGIEVLFRNGAEFITPNAANTDWFRHQLVLYNGSVGIGTDAPDVFGRGYGRTLGISSPTNTAIELNAATGSGIYVDFGVNGARQAAIYSDTAAFELSTLGAIPITFAPNSAFALTILPSGNVGIGTAAPGQKLHVIGTTLLQGNQAAIAHANDTGSIVALTGIRADVAGPDKFTFYGYETNAWIFWNGYVGIGNIANPTAQLHTTGNVRLQGIGGPGVLVTDANGNVSVASASSGSTGAGAVTIGSVIMSASNATPAGYLECDGTAVSRGTYAALYAAIGDTFGAGDGSTTFNLPDMRGRVPTGLGTGDGGNATAWVMNRKIGAELHQLTVAELASHAHDYERYASLTGVGGANPLWANTAVVGTGAAGGDTPHNNVQPSLGIRFVIKF